MLSYYGCNVKTSVEKSPTFFACSGALHTTAYDLQKDTAGNQTEQQNFTLLTCDKAHHSSQREGNPGL